MIRARSSRVSSAGAATLRTSTRGSLCASGAAVNAPRLRLASDTCSCFAASYDRRDAADDGRVGRLDRFHVLEHQPEQRIVHVGVRVGHILLLERVAAPHSSSQALDGGHARVQPTRGQGIALVPKRRVPLAVGRGACAATCLHNVKRRKRGLSVLGGRASSSTSSRSRCGAEWRIAVRTIKLYELRVKYSPKPRTRSLPSSRRRA